MFERFTDRSRRVIVLAQEEARLLDHGRIGTEHVLLGLLDEGDGIAAMTLNSLEITLDAVRTEVQRIVGRGAKVPHGHIPFSPRAKKVLELSLREALQLGHNFIGTEHILLGLIREGQGVAAQILVQLGADLPAVREQTMSLLSGHAGVEPASPSMFTARPVPQLINPGVFVVSGEVPELRQVIALGDPIPLREAATLIPISLTIWSSFVELRYAVSAAHGQPPMIDFDAWSVEDDLGTTYGYTGTGASAQGTLLLGTICFAPPPPREASRISLVGPADARLDIELPTPPPQSAPGPSAEPAQPDQAEPEADDQPDTGGAQDS